ncbi:MAG TPA: hexitol phosphatase HxpB [Cytophagaceae bacterium]
MIKAVIFDMDGLLVDSEPVWREVEIEIFKEVGVFLTNDLCRQTMGLRLDEVVKHWYSIKPWKEKDLKEVEQSIIEGVRQKIGLQQPMEGVREILDFLKSQKVTMALASSSCMVLIETVLDAFQIRDYFSVVQSAESEPYGKPHPGVFLTTTQKLGGINPTQCLVFEDSLNGVLAAKSARMKAVAVPDSEQFHDPRFAIADLKLKSLKDFSLNHWEELSRR